MEQIHAMQSLRKAHRNKQMKVEMNFQADPGLPAFINKFIKVF